jgi:penicillin-binding protein 2
MVTIGIGQDKITVTPLQMANAMCIVANKGHYYIPHFVKNFENETAKDTVLNKYRQKHEVLSHIPDDVYEIVHQGMQDVVTNGTARVAGIPGIDICAKTGTAENKMYLDGRVVQLKDNSMFVCFAPRENPTIAVAVIVENGGFGATWAAPIGSFLVEKYLTDSIRTERMKDVERIAGSNIMPEYLPRLQFKTDSIRAQKWFKLTNDSNYIRKYLPRHRKQSEPAPLDTRLSKRTRQDIIDGKNLYAKRTVNDNHHP